MQDFLTIGNFCFSADQDHPRAVRHRHPDPPGRVRSCGGGRSAAFLCNGFARNSRVSGTRHGVRAHFGKSLKHPVIRALLVHTCEGSEEDFTEVGWGRVTRTLEDVILRDDDAAGIVYQGEISPAKYIRAPSPAPSAPLPGNVSITSTICYKSQTDPHHLGNYTRAGLEVIFGPHDGKYSRDKQLHPASTSFFGSRLPGATEHELRRDAWKWENCLHATCRKRGSSLQNPCFDIHYNSRLESRNFTPSEKLSYAMVVTVRAKGVANLYDQIVRLYATQIEPLRPGLEVQIRT